MTVTKDKRAKLPKMEGAMARWYARRRGSASQLQAYREQAAQLTATLADGAAVLEVAPGPGYLAIEIARLGRFAVSGLDISRTFVDIASRRAVLEGVRVEFRHGDVERMPFAAGTFDLIVCQAAFKNFGQPVVALNEMHRVLRPGGQAVIQDMSREASSADIAAEVRRMRTSRFNGFVIRRTLAGLRLRAASRARFEELAAASAFAGLQNVTSGDGAGLQNVTSGDVAGLRAVTSGDGAGLRNCDIRNEGITTEVRLTHR